MVIFIEGSLPSQDCKMIKLLTTDNLFPLIGILAKARGRMTTLFPAKMTLVHVRALGRKYRPCNYPPL